MTPTLTDRSPSMMRLPTIVAALAALGNGLVLVALGAGLPMGFAIVWASVGFLSLVWAVVTFIRGRIVFLRGSLALFLLPLVLWGVILVLVPQSGVLFPLATMGIACFFCLVVSGVIVWRLRRPSGKDIPPPVRDQRGVHVMWVMLGLVASVVVMSAATIFGLSFTNAGLAANEHSEGPAGHGGHAH